jgi:hypothetical protein
VTNWMQNSYNNLFFDYHTHSSATDVAKGFDADVWMDEVVKMGAKAVSAFAVDAFGWRFYRKGDMGWVHPGLPKDLDLLGELIRAARERDVKLVVYFNTVESEAVALHRPDLRELDVNRQPKSDYEIFDGIVICWLGRAFQELFLPQVEEIVANYDVDAMFFDGTYAHGPCYCRDCETNYRADTGSDLPDGSDKAEWMRWVDWAEQRYEVIRTTLVDTVKRHRPDAIVCFNWYGTLRRPDVMDRPDDIFLSLDLHPQMQLLDASLQARAWTATGIPFICQNTLFLEWWGDWGIKPTLSLKQECASILANGGRIFTGFQLRPDHTLLPDAREALSEMMAFVNERTSAIENTEPVSDIAVVYPTTSYAAKDPAVFHDAALADQQPLGRYLYELPDVFPDEAPTRGAHRSLFELGYDYHIVTEHVLAERLADYRVVVLPGMRCVDPQFLDRVEAWVRQGGHLILTYEPSLLDAAGLRRWHDLAGVELSHEYDHGHAYVQHGGAEPYLVRSRFAVIGATDDTTEVAGLTGIYLREDGRPLLKTSPPGEPTGAPAITRRTVGAGTVTFVAFEPFSAYVSTNQWRLRDELQDLIAEVLPVPRVRTSAGGQVEVTLRRRNNTLTAHLVNHTGYAPRQWGAWSSTVEVAPVHDVVVRLRAPGPMAVRDGETGEQLRWDYDGGVVRVEVPRVDIHRWIDLEFEPAKDS